MPENLSRCGGPASLAKAGLRKLIAIAKSHASCVGEQLVEVTMTVLGGQTVTVPGTADTVLSRLATA